MRTKALLVFIMFIGLLAASCTKEAVQDKSKAHAKDSAECNKQIAKSIVHTAAIMIQEMAKGNPNEKDVILLIRRAIDSVRFYQDGSGYFYVYDDKCVNIAHAMQKDLEGKDLTNYKDTKGKFVIQELAQAASKGGGFVEFYWRKPGDTTREIRKMGYVEPIHGTRFFIGSGIYMD